MLYTIWSIDDSRKHYTDAIKSSMFLPYVEVDCVNGRDPDTLQKEVNCRNLPAAFYSPSNPLTDGEKGIWFTLLNTLDTVLEQNETLLVFEDDAILHPKFESEFINRLDFVPQGFDFFSLFIPRDHDSWADYEQTYDENGVITDGMSLRVEGHHRVNDMISTPWQRYGGVSMLWTPRGAKKMLDLVYTFPYLQWDEFTYAKSRLGELIGYTSNPKLEDLVRISGTEPSLAHDD